MSTKPWSASLLAFGLLTAAACDGDKPPPSSAPPAAGSAGAGGGVAPGDGGASAASAGPGEGARTPMVAKDHALYSRLEGEGFANACAGDSACMKGGCSAEVCAAEDVMTTCEKLTFTMPASGACGCVAGECIWYTSDGSTLPASAGAGGGGGVVGGGGGGGGSGGSGGEPSGGGVRCGDATCAPAEKCIEYFGIAGPSGPRFQTCGIPCGPKRTCPAGKKCVTVADGPGDVCQ